MYCIREEDLENLFKAEIININLTICRCQRCKNERIIDIDKLINNESYIKYKKMVRERDFFRCFYCEFINLLPIDYSFKPFVKKIKYPTAIIRLEDKIRYIDYDNISKENNYFSHFIEKLYNYDFGDE